VAARTMMMQIRSDDLLLAVRTRTVSGSESGRARLAIPGHKAVFSRAADGQSPNAVGVAVTVAIVMISTTVSGCPYEDRTLTIATLQGLIKSFLIRTK